MTKAEALDRLEDGINDLANAIQSFEQGTLELIWNLKGKAAEYPKFTEALLNATIATSAATNEARKAVAAAGEKRDAAPDWPRD